MILLCGLGLAASRSASAQNLDAPVRIEIPAQSLGSALIELGRQTGIQVLVASVDVEGLHAPGVSGTLSAEDALQQLLLGSNLQIQLVGTHSIAIHKLFLSGERAASLPAEPASTKPPSDRSGAASAWSARADVTSDLRGSGNPLPRSRPSTIGSVASSSTESLDEILVTAERIGVDVMHAPISMSAVNGAELQQSEIRNTVDLQFLVPGLTVTNAGLNTYINIRGIGSGFTSPNIAQGVPIYRDGLLVPPNVGDEPLWDVESVQVLRGPQGTLVGANSTGGALFINSVNPTLGSNQGYVQLQGGSYNQRGVQGALSVPVAATVAARVGVYYERRGSFSKDLTPANAAAPGELPGVANQTDPGSLDMLALRGSLLWQPSERLEVLGRVSFFRSQGGYLAEKPIPIADLTVNGITMNCPGPGSYLGANPTTWSAVPPACGYAPFAPANPYQIAYAAPYSLLNEQIWRESLESKMQLTASGLSLRLLAGGAFNTVAIANGGTASTDLINALSNSVHERTITYEADLISPPGRTSSWVLGAYYWFDPAMIRALFENYAGGPLGAGPGYSMPTGGLRVHANATKLSYALFGNVDAQLAPRWKAQIGLRATWDHNSNPFTPCASCPGGDANAFYPGVPNPANPLGPLSFPGYGQANLGYESDAFVSWKGSVNFSVTPTDYVYGLVASGGKSGGIQGQQLGENFAPEKDTDFELGWKATRGDGHVTLQLDGFYTRYTNMQIADTDTVTGQNSIYNAGASRVYGLEFSGQARATNWQLDASASYTQSSFSIGNILDSAICALDSQCSNSQGQCPAGVANGIDGCFNYASGGLVVAGRFYPWLENVRALQLPNSPTLQFNLAVGHDWRLGEAATLAPRIDYAYQGAQYSQIFDTPFNRLPARGHVNLKLTYANTHWLAEAYVTNILGALYPLSLNDTNAEIFNAPRQFGARIQRRF